MSLMGSKKSVQIQFLGPFKPGGLLNAFSKALIVLFSLLLVDIVIFNIPENIRP